MVFNVFSLVLVVTFTVAGLVVYYFTAKFKQDAVSELDNSFKLLEKSIEELRKCLKEEQTKSASYLDIEIEDTEPSKANNENTTKTVKLDDGLEYEIVGGW